MTWVKICGIKTKEDLMASQKYGADAAGFMFAESKRQISPSEAEALINSCQTTLKKVGVFVNESSEKINEISKQCSLDLVQLHGEEPPSLINKIDLPVIKAFRIKQESDLIALEKYLDHSGQANAKACEYFLLDTFVAGKKGGTGKIFDWKLGYKAKKYGKIIIAGGLNPKNVDSAISQARCFGVDVSSGVEYDTGSEEAKKFGKDPLKIKEFISISKIKKTPAGQTDTDVMI